MDQIQKAPIAALSYYLKLCDVDSGQHLAVSVNSSAFCGAQISLRSSYPRHFLDMPNQMERVTAEINVIKLHGDL